MITAGVIGGSVGSISGQVFSLQGLLFGSFFWAFFAGVRLLLGASLFWISLRCRPLPPMAQGRSRYRPTGGNVQCALRRAIRP